MIVIAELLVDWLKHAFITKFNEIPAIVYRGITIRGIDFYCEHKLLYNTFVCSCFVGLNPITKKTHFGIFDDHIGMSH